MRKNTSVGLHLTIIARPRYICCHEIFARSSNKTGDDSIEPVIV